MVDSSDLHEYMDDRMCNDLFGRRYSDPSRYSNYGLVSIYRGIAGDLLTAERDRRLKGLKKNRFVAPAKRRAKIDTPEFRSKVGDKIVSKYLAVNPECNLSSWMRLNSDLINQMIKEELCIGKYISPVEHARRVDKELDKVAEELLESFEKLRTEIICGTVDDPLTELRKFRRYVESGEWITS